MTRTIARKPQGIPVGGQFALHARDDADVTLHAESRRFTIFPIDMDAAVSSGWEDIVAPQMRLGPVPQINWGKFPHSGDPLTVAQSLEMGCHMAAMLRAKGLRVTASNADIAQDALAEVQRKQAQGKAPFINQPMIYRAVGFAAARARYAQYGLRHEDAKALGLFWSNKLHIEAETGRSLTTDELTGLAAQIRKDWPNPRHRPRKGFEESVVSAASE
jgi:hypothetical protein